MRPSDASPEYWIELAALDEEGAEILRREGGPAEICAYHYHQAAEKLLKGAILKTGRSFPFIHDIQRLYLMWGQSTDTSGGPDAAIVRLQAAYTKLRYPIGDRLTMQDLEEIRAAFLFIKAIIYSERASS